MSGWVDSRVFTQAIINPLLGKAGGATNPTGFSSLTADTLKAALFNNTGTPNKDDTVGNTGYNTGQWTTANEVIDSSGNANWVAGGVALSSPAVTNGTGFWEFSAANTPGAGTLTITNAYGALVYDNTISAGTVAKQGMCYNYFGGANSVTLGTFTIVWNANGIMRITN